MGLNRVLRTKGARKKLLRSRSDKLLTTLRRLENQKSFIKPDGEEEFIKFPFNKPAKKKPTFQRKPFGEIQSNMKKQKATNGKAKVGTESENKENMGEGVSQQILQKSAKKTNEGTNQVSKIFINDAFDLGLITEMEAKKTFMLGTILRSAIMNR